MRAFADHFFEVVIRIDFVQLRSELLDLLVDLLKLQCVLAAVLVHQLFVILLYHLVVEVVFLNLSKEFFKFALMGLDLFGGEGVYMIFGFEIALPAELILRVEDLPFRKVKVPV